MKWNILLAVPVVATALIAASIPASAEVKHQDTVQDAIKVFQEMMANPKTRVPARLIQRSQAVAIIPAITQAGFIIGGRHGTGVMMKHNADGSWSNPVFVSISGGSIGLQAGAKSTDTILVFPSRYSLSNVLKGNKVDIGGSVSGTAVDAQGTAAQVIDDRSSSEKIYAFSRSEGLYGGVTLAGAKLSVDNGKDKDFYGRPYSAIQILSNPNIQAPVIVRSLKNVLYR